MTELTVGVVIKILATAAYPFLEYYLGKTHKIKANSVLELVLNGALFILKSLSKTNSDKSTGGG